uniref:non-specific serine/threonine protein kinase n=1 Tax=Brassica oleracea var. oleracea TaxID=109376 RepID=A0A0D3BT47_BRAOL
MGCSWSKNQPLSDGELQNILGKPLEDIKKLYSFGKELGKRTESEHIVMELCGGGELSSRIEAHSYYSEKDSAGILKSIANALQTCHSMGVIHRDVKPENFLFSSEVENTMLKAIGFGSSVYIKQETELKGKVGSKYYLAPEVLQGKSYGKEIDIWSAGVILYLLLCGKHPFKTESEIRRGSLDLERKPWPCVSESAKDLVKKMLTKDPKSRISASNVLGSLTIVLEFSSSSDRWDETNITFRAWEITGFDPKPSEHSWIRIQAPYKPIDNVLVLRMKRFGAMNKLKKLALNVIVEGLEKELIKDDKDRVFKSMDTDGSGSITYGELRNGLNAPRSHPNLSLSEARQLMEAADVDGNGRLDLYEYISATTETNVLVTDENCTKHSSSLIKMVAAGFVQDERIDYEEFCAMMRDGKLQPQGKRLNRGEEVRVVNLEIVLLFYVFFCLDNIKRGGSPWLMAAFFWVVTAWISVFQLMVHAIKGVVWILRHAIKYQPSFVDIKKTEFKTQMMYLSVHAKS